MGISRLQLYNKALLACGERFLSSLEEPGEPRRLLDEVWATDGVQYALEQGAWQFAMRTARVEVDADFTPPTFGLRNAFSKPTDWVRTDAVCQDEYYTTPLLQYADEVGHWFADIEPIYVKFVSKDDQYGMDLANWPATFCDFVANVFASRIIGKLGGDRSRQMEALFGPSGFPQRGQLEISMHKARSAAMLTQPTKFPAPGSWVQSRYSGRRGGPMGDGGNSGSLIG